MRITLFVAIGIVLVCGIVFSQSVDEATSVTHPYTSLTPGALRVDPARTKALVEAAAKTYEESRVLLEAGSAVPHDIFPASKRLMEIEVGSAKNKNEARVALANHASRMNELRKKIEAMMAVGVIVGGQRDLHYAQYAAIEAEILLLNAGGRLDD
ncbi:MAG TPA: hypothetical protein VHC22_00740 [Pirellulales bacterium]|nr:hypothetical protein [Pirellulales bacterium]